MSNVYDFDESRKAFLASAASSLSVAEHSPDDAARAFELSKASGVDATTIANNKDQFEQDFQTHLGGQITRQSPAITSFLNAHPLHPALIKDDLGALDQFSSSYSKMTSWHPFGTVYSSYAQASAPSEDFDPIPFQAAAQRLAQAARPWAGRQKGLATRVPEAVTSSLLWNSTVGLVQAAQRLTEKALTGELHRQILSGDITSETAGESLAVAMAVSAGLRVGRPQGMELREGEILPPEAKPPPIEGLPEPGPTIEGEPTDMSRRGFLQGVGAASAAAALPKGIIKGPLERFQETLAPWFQRVQAEGMDVSGLVQQLEAIAKEAETLRPWAEAGEEPPAGISQIADKGREEQAKLDQDIIKEAIDDAKATALKERSPEKFAEFLDHHPQGTIAIEKEAILKFPDAFKWIPSVGVPEGKVEVSAKDFIANFDPELWSEVKDFVSRGGMTKNELEGLKLVKEEPPEQVATHAVEVGGKVYTGDTHLGAYNEALKEYGGVDPGGSKRNLFQTSRGRIITQKEAIDLSRESLGLELGDPVVASFRKVAKKPPDRVEKELFGWNLEQFEKAPDEVRNAIERFRLGVASRGDEKLLREHGLRGLGDIQGVPKVTGAGVEITQDPVVDSLRKAIGLAANEPLISKVLERSRSGRPTKREPLPIGTEGAILEAGFDKALPESEPSLPFEKGQAFGRTQKEYERLLKAIEEQTNDDAAWLKRRGEAQAKLEASVAWKEEAAKIEPDIRAGVLANPMIAAWTRLKKVKLDPQELTLAQAQALPELVGPGGLHPDDAAGQFGFSTGADLLRALQGVADEAAAGKGDIVDRLVKAEVQRVLQEKLGKTPKEVLDDKIDQALSLSTMEMLHEQVLALGTRLGGALPLNKAAMDWGAVELLKGKPYAKQSAIKLLNQAATEFRKIEKAIGVGKELEAFQAMQNQYLLTAQAKEMRAVEKEGKEFDRNAKRWRSREVANFPIEHTNFIHDILSRVGKQVNRSPEDLKDAIDRSGYKSLDEFVDHLSRVEGWDVPVAEFLRDSSKTKNVKDMTVGEFRALNYSIRTLIKRGRDSEKVYKAGEAIDRKDLVDAGREYLQALGPPGNVPLNETPTYSIFHAARMAYWSNITTERVFERWARGNPRNVFTEWLANPLIAGGYHRMEMTKEFSKIYRSLGKIGKPGAKVDNDLFLDPDKLKDGIEYYIPMTHLDAMAVLANMGNLSNASKLASGYNLRTPDGKPDVERIRQWLFRTLSPKDFDWMQNYWDKITKELKRRADVNAVAESDVPAENIPLEGFDTPWGKHYEGGYQKLMPHYMWEGKPQAEAFNLEGREYTRASTPRRFEKERTGATYPISLDFNRVVQSSMTEMIHDIAIRGPVREFAKALRDQDLRRAIRMYDNPEVLQLMEEWLKSLSNSGTPPTKSQAAFYKPLAWYRKNVVGNTLNFRLSTPMKHGPSSLMRSIVEVGPIEFLWASTQLLGGPLHISDKNMQFVNENSREIPQRDNFWENTITGATEQVTGKAGIIELGQRLGRSMVALSDAISTRPTWLAAFNKVYRETGDIEFAKLQGDTAVVKAHGSANPARKAPIMLGGPISQLYTSYMGWFNTVAQAFDESMWRQKYGWDSWSKGEWQKGFQQNARGVYLLASTVLIIGAVEHYVEEALKGDDPREVKKGAGRKVADFLLRAGTAPYPLVRDIAYGLETGGDFAFGIAGSGLQTIYHALVEGSKAIDEATRSHGKLSPKTKSSLIQQGLGGIGIFTGGLPGEQIGMTAAGFHRWLTGQERPQTGWDAFRLLARGHVHPRRY